MTVNGILLLEAECVPLDIESPLRSVDLGIDCLRKFVFVSDDRGD